MVVLSFNQDAVFRILTYVAYDLMLKFFLFVKHESDLYWQHIDVTTYLIAQSAQSVEPCSIFFCGDNHLWRGHGLEYPIDFLFVFACETVVISERQGGDAFASRLHVYDYLLW